MAPAPLRLPGFQNIFYHFFESAKNREPAAPLPLKNPAPAPLRVAKIGLRLCCAEPEREPEPQQKTPAPGQLWLKISNKMHTYRVEKEQENIRRGADSRRFFRKL